MKLSDGLFHSVFEEVGAEYHDIEREHLIVDIGAAKLADTPEKFDVIVLPNLYGDILSDVAAQISGSIGLGASANIGDSFAMFEAIHGSAPKRAGQDCANPSGLILASVMMLDYLGQQETAERIHNAWLTAIEEGYHTYDIFKEGVSKEKLGTKAFGDAVAKSLGKKPTLLAPVTYKERPFLQPARSKGSPPSTRTLVGADIFLYSTDSPEALQKKLRAVDSPLALQLLTNRGATVWPQSHKETFCVDQFRARFEHAQRGKVITQGDILQTLSALDRAEFDIIKIENLYFIDGSAAFSHDAPQ